MEIILTKDVENLGYKNDLKRVKSGYARNYLIPKGLAIVAHAANKKVLAETTKQQTVKEEKLIEGYNAIADALKASDVQVGTKVSSKGKIYGSITTLQIAEAIGKLGHDVNRKQIKITSENIKETGKYEAHILLHKEVEFTINFEIVEE